MGACARRRSAARCREPSWPWGWRSRIRDSNDAAAKDKALIAKVDARIPRSVLKKLHGKASFAGSFLGYDMEKEGAKPEINSGVCPGLIGAAEALAREIVEEYRARSEKV